MKVQLFQQTSPLKQECEDALICNEALKLYGVCDGATPLIEFQDENGHNGAYLASHLFRQHFESISNVYSLQTEVAIANQLLQEKMQLYHIDMAKKDQLWCTCIAAIHITDKTIEYAQLGDCMIVAKFVDGSVKVLTEDTVKGISKRAKQQREEDRKKGLSVPNEAIFTDKKEQLRYNRYMANTLNGYSVANGMNEAISLIQQGELLRQEIANLFICSDGLFHLEWPLEISAQFVWEHGIKKYLKIIEELEAKQLIHPDDKTAIIIHL
ncbi:MULTISPECIES: protein phosphatase 2C domain-containing protein [unclassified Bacillus (in: firmicutes)]|uniref:protein phosphatase 2C domain-containing protein n=1 Tax=unclassified Bacillus (in: firmicutes) TaxID=185979 RepID=UPI0008F2D80D|nr:MULTISPECIES: protein phosphatase 2C domain-containing protein [unclassified Bacillus (in: firmicutes)]SFI31266.1 Serine/threonine protein phosphatase PrpC [Bacillus sp. 71mf]SFS37858.1 Serine/threonine protein phosphatase PrpC [Bacillus sp. 103mf]